MSTTIDQRVVEMRFDNKQFEAGVSTTMSTLEKLKQKLKLTEATKGLEDVSAAAKNCDVSSVGIAAEKVGLKFNAMYSIADQALRNITNSAMVAGKRIASALTIDPIKTGFSEYETQINAVQTILANTESKGKTLDDVNGALDELNKYADKTIYNFTEMTRNIGTFTAAGVDLDTSVSAIKGIANLAAVSGSTSQQASTAMYQLSQAMASGTVKLMDWNSVVNAGMGGQVFQDALKETAKVHGVAIDDIIAKQGSFRESLSEGWLTTEILTDTLAKFTGDLSKEQLKAQGYTDKQIEEIMKLGQTANDAATKVKTFSQLFDTLKEAAQSGWTQTWEILVGDFEEAKELLTSISDAIGGIIGKSAESRNELLENWKVLGGRQDLIESFKNIFEAIVSVVTPIKEAFREIFPPMTAERLKSITEAFKEFTAKLKLSDTGMENLKRTFKGVFAVVKVFTTILKAAFKAIGIVFDGVGGLGGGLLGVTAVIGDLLVAFAQIITSGNIFERVFVAIGKTLKFIVKIIVAVVKGFADLINFAAQGFVFPGIDLLIQAFRKLFGGMNDVSDTAGSMKDKFIGAFQAMGEAIKGSFVYKFLTTVWSGLKKIFVSIGKTIGNVFSGIFERMGNTDIMGILDIIKGIVASGVGVALIKFLNNLGKPFKGIESILESFSGILDGVADSLNAFQQSIKANAIKTIAVAIAILAASILLLSFIDKDKLANALSAIVILMGSLKAILGTINKKEMAEIKVNMTSFAAAILILALALKTLSGLNMDQISKGLVGLGGIMALLVGAIVVLGKNESKVKKSATTMLGLALTVKILASVLKDLSTLNIKECSVGLLGLFGIMTLLAGVMKVLGTITDYSLEGQSSTSKMQTKMISIGIAMLALAAAVRIIVPAVKQLGSLDWNVLGKAGVVFAALLAAMAIFALELKMVKPENITSAASSLLIMSVALYLLAGVFAIFGNMPWKVLGKAGVVLGGIVVALLGLAAASKIASGGTMATMAASLIIVAIALQMLVPVIMTMTLIKWSALAKAGTVMAGLVAALTLLGLVSKYTQPGTLAAMAASLIILGIALHSIIPSILILSLIPVDRLMTAGLAIGGIVVALAYLGVASAVASPSSILALAGSISVLAIGLTLLTVPLMIFSSLGMKVYVGLALLATALLTLGVVAHLMQPIAPIFFTISASVALLGAGLLLAGAGLSALGAGLAALLAGLGAGLAVFGAGLLVFIETLGAACISATKAIIEIIVVAIEEICLGIVRIAGPLADAIMAVIVLLCDVIVEGVTVIVDAILVLVINVLAALAKHTPDIIMYLGEFLVALCAGLIDYVPKLIDLIIDLVIVILDGIAARLPDIIQAIVDLVMSIFEGCIQAFSNIDTKVLLEGLGIVAILTGLAMALGALAPMIPSAMAGVLGLGVIIVELAAVIAALGAIFNGDGTMKLLEGGGEVLGALGTAIGKLIGGFVGGLAQGMTGAMPQIAEDLSNFMDKIGPFIEGAKNIDSSVNSGVRNIVDVIKLISGASLKEFMTSALIGESSVTAFSSQLEELAKGITNFSNNLGSDVDPAKIESAAGALVALAKMADLIPNEGGWIAKLVGDNTIGVFGDELPRLGAGLNAFSASLTEGNGISPTNIETAVTSLRALIDMAAIIPNDGGWLDKIAGSNSIANFGDQLPKLGKGLTDFSNSLGDMTNENIKGAVEAAKGLVEISQHIPNEGGMRSWFSGDSGMVSFAENLGPLGDGIKAFAIATEGITAESISGPVDAAVSLAGLTDVIPNEGGVWAWFSGDSGMVTFATNLGPLGDGIKAFAVATEGITSESLSGAVGAAVSLAEMTEHIPKEGGMLSWFSGDSGMVTFASNLGPLGDGIKAFAIATEGITSDSVSAAVGAAKTLAEMTEHIPKEDGLISWFSGDSGVAKFATELPLVGEAIKKFSDALGKDGINPEALKAAAGAASALAEMTTHIPKEGGIKAWFTGETNVADFADKLPKLGEGIKSFSTSVNGINPDNVTAAASAAESLAKLTEIVPENFDSVITFGDSLVSFGGKLAEYFKATANIKSETIESSTNAVNSLKSIGGVDAGNKLKALAEGIDKVTESFKNLAKAPTESISSFTTALKDLGKSSADAFVSAFDNIDDDLKKKGQGAIDGFNTGVKNKKNAAKNQAKDIAQAAADAAGTKKSSFKEAGKDMAQGFADGISANAFKAEAQAKAMAEAAVEAAREELDINSPSKVFRAMGYSIPEGMAMGIDKLSSLATDSAVSMADASIKGVKHSISRIADVINGDMDAQPTIRPVLDLSDLKSGARSIGGLFDSGVSIGATANIGAINSMMNKRNQNGTNNDVVSAINKLSKAMDGAKGDTYNFGDLSYSDDSNVENAVKELVRAMTMGRRA